MKDSTSKLLDQLKNKNISLEDYLLNNADSFIVYDIKEFWDSMIIKSRKTKSDVINRSEISYSYFYDIINGRKTPTFDMVIRLSLAMHLTLDETNEALRFSGKRLLTPRIKRDAVIIKSIVGKETVSGCNNALKSFGEETLK